MLRPVTVMHILAVAAMLFLPAATCTQADSGITAEDGSAAPIASPGVVFLEGTTIDQALAPALVSAATVPVIIVLKDQPLHQISDQVQATYTPQIRQRAMAVRAILAKYAGPRNFGSPEEMRAQARLEAESVSAADRDMKKQINQEADELLGRMRKESQRRIKTAVAVGQAEVSAAVLSLGGKVNYCLLVQNSVTAIVPGTAIAEISRHPLVSFVMTDRVYETLLDVSGPTIFVNSFWAVGENGGIFDGAVCDSGVDTAHPALDDDTVAARTWYSRTFHATAQTRPNYNDNPTSTDDLHGHGTHVAGIMFSSDTTYRGVAYGADIGMNLKAGFLTTTLGASSTISDVEAALDWAQAHTQEPEVVNYSYGAGTSADDPPFCQFFDAFTESQICTTVIAAGNSGVAGAESVESPSIAHNCICVANMAGGYTTSRADDVINASSSRGPTHGGRRKPDITAPGTEIKSAWNTWEDSGNFDFTPKTGTSMAAPHVAGATLLLNDAGVFDPREVKAILLNTAEDRGDPGWDAAYGWGYLDLDRAYIHRGDVFLHSVAPQNQPGWYRLYKTTGMDAGESATMTWYRRALYVGSSDPTTVYSLNDLNLRLYDEATGVSIASDLTGVDNVHQVTSDRSGTQVIKVYAWSGSFSHGGGTETYALATQEGTTLVAAEPTITPSASNYTPPLYAKFNISVRVYNAGEVAANNCTVTLALPAGLVLAEGSLTQNIGSVPAGGSGYASFKLDTTSSGVKTVNVSTYSSSYGLTYTGSGSFTVTPGAPDTVAPYTTMGIGSPTYQTGGTDKLTNGGFESGFTAWTTSGTAALETGSTHNGTYNVKLGPGAGAAYQTVSISSGASFATLTFWYKCSASVWASIGCRITDSSGNTLVTPFTSNFSASAWSKVTIDVGRFIGQTIRVHFYSNHGGFDDSTMRVDDVTLKENEYVYVGDTSLLSLWARDDDSGIDYTEYKVGSDPYTTYVGPFTLAGLSDGYGYMYYRTVDNSANFEAATRARFYVDSQAPKSVLSISSPCSITGGSEKVANGGFENSLTNWTAAGAAIATTLPVHSGSRAAKVGATAAGSIYQVVAVGSGASRAFLSVWYKSVGGAGTTYTSIRVIDPATGRACHSIDSNYTADWQQMALDVSRFKGQSVRVEFAVVTSSGASATLYVDDVSVRESGSAHILPLSLTRIYSLEDSGVQKYERNVDSAGYVAGQEFSIAAQGTHSVLYRALDNLDHQEPVISTQFIVDGTGPMGSTQIDYGAVSTTSLNVTLSPYAYDPAGVSMMRIQSDAGIWGPWQPYALWMYYTLTTTGEGTKTVGIQFQDALGNVGPIYSDDILYQIATATDIPGAKKIPDGESVRLENKIITAIFTWSGCFYIEEEDRRSGIRVRAEQLEAEVGDRVIIEGVTDTVYAEREIVAQVIEWVDQGPLCAPLGMTNGTVGGGPFHYQPGAPGAKGLNNTGLLVRTTGRVAEHYADRFYIADGSALFNPWPPEPILLIDCQELFGWVPPLDSYVSITGISGMETVEGGSPIRVLRPRGLDDIQINQIDAAYIYDTDSAAAASFKSLLDSENVKTDLISMADVESVDLSDYDIILIGNDTGLWNDDSKFYAVDGAGKPIVAIGEGGAYYLDWATAYIGWWNCTPVSASQGVVEADDILTYPHNLGLSSGDTITVYSSTVEALAVYDPGYVVPHMLRMTTAPEYVYVASDGSYYLWGFYPPPSAMTQTGKNLFTNLVFRALKP